MGSIRAVWDADLRRKLAMKVLAVSGATIASESSGSRSTGRFLEEAQITAQLDHPGVVPVHELGVDEEGRPFFTMKLVRGRELSEVFDLAAAGREGWSPTRVLWVLLRVCETLGFAHQKGVIHRDLKPANVMVGSFGEVYVMDWGLARVLGRAERSSRQDAPERSLVRSDRRSAGDATSPGLLTQDGDVVGTPAYMAPEQARGEVDALDSRADVYAVGAMLYHLLSGQAPYVPVGTRPTAGAVLQMLIEGPPRRLAVLAPRAAPELIAICERAMSRDRERRYADVGELGEDLRAFLESRVVRAYDTGAAAELRKWIARHRVEATAVAAAALALGASLVVALTQKARADESAARAREAAELARRERENVLRLSAFQRLLELKERAAVLWPMVPINESRFEEWLRDAGELVRGLDSGIETSDPGHRGQVARLEARGVRRPDGEWTFPSAEDRWWHAQLTKLVAEIEAFADPDAGWIEGLSPEPLWGVRRRLEFALSVREQSLDGPDARVRWESARAAIADPARHPQYGGLEVAPQLGLVPLGPDRASGLWEFAVLATGEVPGRDVDGRLRLGPESAVVLVLIPGGAFEMGAQATSPGSPNHDPDSRANEGPVHRATLAPYFLSKNELTQAQWIRLTGSNPSYFGFGGSGTESRPDVGQTNPVEQVTWTQAVRVLSAFGLSLPTEAQWERAARGGTSSVWWTGAAPDSLEGAANVNDATALAAGVPWRPAEEWLEDGFVVHAPVGSLSANPFGLHDVHGNVMEWCADTIAAYTVPARPGDGLRLGEGGGRVMRGGSFGDPVTFARCAARGYMPPETINYILGVRPARAVEGALAER